MKKIVTCDNDADILELMAAIFEQRGYEVVPFRDCESLMQNISNIKPQLILMDLNVPQAGGYAAIKHLKSDPATSSIPVLLVSGAPELRNIAQEAGADDFIGKPFDLKEILSKVKALTK